MLDDQCDSKKSPILIKDYLIAILILSLGLGAAKAFVSEIYWRTDAPEVTCDGMWDKVPSTEKSARADFLKTKAIVGSAEGPSAVFNPAAD